MGKRVRRRPRLRPCLFNVGRSILLCLALMQLTAVVDRPLPVHLLQPACPGCDAASFDRYVLDGMVDRGAALSRPLLRPQWMQRSNGYLRVSCKGGLNQMRSSICDMVAVAKHLKLTLIVPELDKESYWADPSDFEDIFDLDHFIDSLKDQVRIIKGLPTVGGENLRVYKMSPVPWSNHNYYTDEILPLFQKYEVVHLNRTDFRLANNGLPMELQKLRCRVNYEALRFTPKIQAMADDLVSVLRRMGPSFVVLHLRYEMDMLSFTGCASGCSEEETEALTRMRYSRSMWREKEIDSEKSRSLGLCPLTPEEVTFVLQALGFGPDTLIYIASGKIYGGERRLAALKAAYPRLVPFPVVKEMLFSEENLRPFQNRLSQMAAVDYLASLESDIFIPTYGGNMAKLVEGHRRYMGFRKTIVLDRRKLVQLLDLLQNGTLPWDQFANAVRSVHRRATGEPARRKVIRDRPKEEDYFHANPYECLSHVR